MPPRSFPSWRQSVHTLATQLADEHIQEGSDRQLEITEGRKDWSHDGTTQRYAWCGDFVTYVLMQSQSEAPNCLNRIQTRGKWEPGKNISMLIDCARAVGKAYYGKDAYARVMEGQIADILILDVPNGGHVCFLDQVNSASSYVTADGNTVGRQTGRRIRNFTSDRVVWALDLSTFFPVAASQDAPLGSTPPSIILPDPGLPPAAKKPKTGNPFPPIVDIASAIGVLSPFPVGDILSYQERDDNFYDEGDAPWASSNMMW